MKKHIWRHSLYGSGELRKGMGFMKFVLFGGLVFIGGCIMMAIGQLGSAIQGIGYGDMSVLNSIGPGAMMTGVILGVIGLFVPDKSNRP